MWQNWYYAHFTAFSNWHLWNTMFFLCVYLAKGNVFYMPISLLSTACSNWYSCCKEQIKLVKWGEKANASASVYFAVVWATIREAGNLVFKHDFKFWTETLVAKTVQKIACLLNTPFSFHPLWPESLICGVGVASILVQYTPEYSTKYTQVYTVYNVYTSTQYAKYTPPAPSTPAGLVWSGQGHFTSTTLDWSVSKEALDLKTALQWNNVFLSAQISLLHYSLFLFVPKA